MGERLSPRRAGRGGFPAAPRQGTWALRPVCEVMESRRLLATLEFSAGLGEQSTLDSVVQSENQLSNLSTPNSQKFTHNDGPAVSNVTLTTAASTTDNPGVNLDILSQGSVAENGIASVAVNAGLSDTSGNIGASVPVTIVASDPSEQTGDPVNVQFAFSFNVEKFASNNATATFAYSASYTYNGVTTPLASNTDQLGGSGVTPIGSGPLDTETGTLHAKIGDTFTLTFSENLAGQTIAPYLGDGINNVGWLVDANLDASIAPAIILDSVSTTDSREVTVEYDIQDPSLTQPFAIQIYRSDQPTYDRGDQNNVAVGQPVEVTDLTQGVNEVSIDLSQQNSNWGSPTSQPGQDNLIQPLAPDPLLPYVLAVATNVPDNVAVNESDAHFRIYVIGAVSVGFQFGVTADNSNPPDWVNSMAAALGPGPGGYAAVIPFSWASGKWDSDAVYRAGTNLYLDIAGAAWGLENQLQPNDVIDVQLIGHSRGSVVIGLAMEELLESSPNEQLAHGYYKMTFLDPHPANQNTIKDSSTFSPGVFLYNMFFSTVVNDPPIDVPARVNQVEEYYQNNPITGLSWATRVGSPYENVLNLFGDPSQITIDDPASTIAATYNLSSLGLGHSEVHDWYMKNIVPTLYYGGINPSMLGIAPASDSGPSSGVTIDQLLQQILYPDYIDDQDEANGLTNDLSMASTNVSQGNYAQAIDELKTFDIATQAAPAADFTGDSSGLLVSIGQGLIGDLDSTDVADVDSSTAEGTNATATVEAGDSANNQQISGTLTTGSQSSGTAQFTVANYTQSPDGGPSGQVSEGAFDVRATGVDATASASVSFNAEVPTQQLQQAALSYFGDDGQWHTLAEYNGSAWVQLGPSGTAPIQEQDSPVSGTDMRLDQLPYRIRQQHEPRDRRPGRHHLCADGA